MSALGATPLHDTAPAQPDPLVRSHLRVGWLGLAVFAALGTSLEALHAWKSFEYLGVGNETRRLMWTLAHAHGIGMSLVQIAFAATVALVRDLPRAQLQAASRLLHAAFALMPTGFFLGGVVTYGGDPSLGIVLVPIGALLLVLALGRVSWALL
jgi:hypothetical protein